MVNRSNIVLILFCLLTGITSAQLSEELPIRSSEVSNPASAPEIFVAQPDMNSVHAQDKIEDTIKDIPYRFGIPVEYDLDLISFSTEQQVSGGTIYRSKINAPGARSLNLIFSEYNLPTGGCMHIYNGDKSQILGGFTEKNEQENSQFATSLIFDDNSIIELFIPHGTEIPRLKLGVVIYGYRSLEKGQAGFGESGDCNINVSCPEGQNWQREKQSVVLIAVSQNTRLCSGALINNVREDRTPFILTANHCNLSPNNIYFFNFESSRCFPPLDSSLDHSMTGATILARNAYSDFALVELNNQPPASFNPYYAGWDNTGERPSMGVGIHHPKGDLKKISFNFKPLGTYGFPGKGKSHWEIEYWDKGTTENVSSGSPLFNEDHRIVGQLQGGLASCTTLEESDYYGKFFWSWDLESDNNRQLKHWLDPDNTGATVLNGYDPKVPPGDYNIALQGFPEFRGGVCGTDSIYPEVLVRNKGTQQVNSVDLSVFVNNVFQHKSKRVVNLSPGQTAMVGANALDFNTGIYGITVKASLPGSNDADTSDNIVSTEFYGVKEPVDVELVLVTDDYESETSWQVLTNAENELYAHWNYVNVPGNITVRDTFCLYDGCFKYKIFDDVGDGICCKYGNGSYLIRNLSNGDTLLFVNDFKGLDSTHSFCIGDSCSVIARASIRNASLTGAKDGSITIEMINGVPPFQFNWSNNETTKDISNLDPGVYTLIVEDSIDCSRTFEYEIGIGTGVTRQKSDLPEIKLYPNPTSGILNIENIPGPRSLIRIYDIRGNQVFIQRMPGNQNQYQIDIGGLSNGIYILSAVGQDWIQTSRLVINK